MVKKILLLIALAIAFSSSAKGISYNYRDHIIHGPFANKIFCDSEIYFSRSQDDNFPVYMIMESSISKADRSEKIIDKYDVAGSPPTIESAFFYDVKGKKNIFVIVSWEINSRGIGTYGKLYQVFSYENREGQLVSNDLIRFNSDMGGIDGYQEGERSVFNLKTAQDVRIYIKNNF